MISSRVPGSNPGIRSLYFCGIFRVFPLVLFDILVRGAVGRLLAIFMIFGYYLLPCVNKNNVLY